MKLGKADSLGRGKGFLLLFTFLDSEGGRGTFGGYFGVGDGSHLGAQDSPSP